MMSAGPPHAYLLLGGLGSLGLGFCDSVIGADFVTLTNPKCNGLGGCALGF
ncbi:hypothetical protein J2S94_003358 [Arthrobacter bambusae]|nr:hypothetical protein [Arthrobacter bambusae]